MKYVGVSIGGTVYSLPEPAFDGETHTLAIPNYDDPNQDKVYKLTATVVAENRTWVVKDWKRWSE